MGEVGAAAFGDVMKLSLRIRDGRIEEARFQAFGCGTAIATASAMTELIQGRTVDEALKFSNQQVIDALGGLPAEKIHCSMLAEEPASFNASSRHASQNSKATSRGTTRSRSESRIVSQLKRLTKVFSISSRPAWL